MATNQAEPAHILYLDASRNLYGASRVLLILLQGIDRQRFRPYVALANDLTGEDIRFPSELNRLGIPFCETRLAVLRRSKYLNLRGVLWLSSVLATSVPQMAIKMRRMNVRLVHTNTSTVLTGALASVLTRTPHIWTVHEIMQKHERRVLSRFIHLFSSRVVAVSQAVANNLCEGYAPIRSKLVVIRNGIDPEPFQRATSATVEKLRREWNIIPGDLIVGMVGKLGGWKGEYLFVEAARLIVSKYNRVKFVIVGGGLERHAKDFDKLHNLIKETGLKSRVIVAGFCTDIPAILNTFDVFVLPSIKPDPFPTVILEAMAAGKPVIATTHGGPPEMVLEGITGFLVDHRDPHQIA